MPTSCHRIERHDAVLRHAFCSFVQSVFKGADFHLWAAHGGWSEDYEVWVVLHEGRVVSGAGVMRMDLVIHGRRQTGWQIGAVATTPAWRGRGLSRVVLQAMLEHIAAHGEAPVFLFANSSVLDFYPRFGFRRVMQQQYRAEVDIAPQPGQAIDLDIRDAAQREMLAQMYRRARSVDAKFSVVGYYPAAIFHLLHLPRRCVHLPRHDAVLIVRQEGDRLYLDDVVAAAPIDLHAVLPAVIAAPLRHIEFGFRPSGLWNGETQAGVDGEMLFLRGAPDIEAPDLHFPDLAHT